MKSQSTVIPLKIHDLGDGSSHFNYNIQETEEKEFIYDQVIIENPVNFGKIVQSLVLQKYSISDELSIHRQRDTKQEKWKEYFDYVENCKIIARDE